MRTAAIPFQSDTVGSRVTETRAVAFDVAASNFLQAIYPSLLIIQ